MTFDDFCREFNITATAKRADSNPNMTDMGAGARHWSVRLHCGATGRAHTLPFSQGSAHTAAPTAVDVLQCLQSDCMGVDGDVSFESWAEEMGYDTDSRKAEGIYRACQAESLALMKMLGGIAYDALMACTE